MKRILVLDNSEAVRETIALLLEREFLVEKRAAGTDPLEPADIPAHFELVVYGVSSATRGQWPGLISAAQRLPCPVLFIIDSPPPPSFGAQERIGYLIKPLDPYRIRAEVERLAAIGNLAPAKRPLAETAPARSNRYIEFPFVSRIIASLVQRFAASGLPVLISGEIGCGQERVAQAMAALREQPQARVTVNAAEISEDYLTQQIQKLSARDLAGEKALALTIYGIDRLTPDGQDLLSKFIDVIEEKSARCQVLATSHGDLLQRVYSGQYSAALYYRLATLTLGLAPLRERQGDIATIAQRLAETHATGMQLGAVSFSTAAKERLEKYLWFGNLGELESVIARTLVIHRKPYIEEADLIFDIEREFKIGPAFRFARNGQPDTADTGSADLAVRLPEAPPPATLNAANFVAATLPELRVFIHELTHELKNPMVTIKTFAQLLADRYQDEGFRARYKEVVDEDIGRIDQLLEVMVEFADFGPPRKTKVALGEQARALVNEMGREFAKRQVPIGWEGSDSQKNIHADEAQLRYILKNLFLAALSQAKSGTPITIALNKPGRLSLAYLGEGTRVASIPAHLGSLSPGLDAGGLPLRVLLAQQLAARNQGTLTIDLSDNDKDAIEIAFPVA